jgi:hypothetical protein
LRYVPSIPGFFKAFSWRILNFVKGFCCIYLDDGVVFVLNSVYVFYYVNWFVCVEPFPVSLEWNLFDHSVWSFLTYCWIQFVRILLRIFVSMFIGEIGL